MELRETVLERDVDEASGAQVVGIAGEGSVCVYIYIYCFFKFLSLSLSRSFPNRGTPT